MGSKPRLTAVPEPIPAPTVPVQVLPGAVSLFFESAPVFANSVGGTLTFTLCEGRSLPDGAGGVINEQAVVGFLRCSVPGAQHLKACIENALLAAQKASATVN